MEKFFQFPGSAAGERRPRGAGAETGPRAAAGKDATPVESRPVCRRACPESGQRVYSLANLIKKKRI